MYVWELEDQILLLVIHFGILVESWIKLAPATNV
jgi:hypothetical protein